MESYQERPATRWDRALAVFVIGAGIGGIAYMAWRVAGQPDQAHPVEFVTMALLMGLVLYFLWLMLALSTVRYVLKGDRMLFRQGWSRVELPLTTETHLYRWRQRWAWDGGAQRDLGVEGVALFPPFWAWREKEIWVLHTNGRAVAFRPSGRLLSEIKSRVRHVGAQAG